MENECTLNNVERSQNYCFIVGLGFDFFFGLFLHFCFGFVCLVFLGQIIYLGVLR